MYIPRLLEKSLREGLKHFPAVFVGGPRRAGKTMLVRHLLKDASYVLLDEMNIRRSAAEDPQGFLDEHKPPVILDEIQNVPELLSYVKARIDRNKKPGQWILTGSQQWALMKGVGETLAGRIAILHLYPFSLAEISKNTNEPPLDTAGYLRYLKNATQKNSAPISPGKWIMNGGYPEVVLAAKKNRPLWFSSYMQTYIDRDVRGNLRDIHLRDFERFVRLLAARTGQELQISSLAGDVGVTVPTIKAWLTLLEASGLIFFLMPYYKNFGKRIIKAPKCYFMDTGLVAYLVGLQDERHALGGPMAGALFETACVSEIYKRLSLWGAETSMYYYRSCDGLEVDVLIDNAGSLCPIEIKLSSTLDPDRVRNLQKWRRLAKHDKEAAFVISTSSQTSRVSTKIQNVHYSWL